MNNDPDSGHTESSAAEDFDPGGAGGVDGEISGGSDSDFQEID
jgi:hypothetical protein